MTTQSEITQRNHRRAVRFFWFLLVGATTVSVVGNVAHAVLPYISGRRHPDRRCRCASHRSLGGGARHRARRPCRGIRQGVLLGCRSRCSHRCRGIRAEFPCVARSDAAIGYSRATAWVFPAIVDTTVAVSTLMLVALGDKPARRSRTMPIPANAEAGATQRPAQKSTPSAKAQLAGLARTTAQSQKSASASLRKTPTAQDWVQIEATQADADFASELIASGVTTQPVETVFAVLASTRGGASINAAAKASGINYRTAQRIVQAASTRRAQQLTAVS